MYPICLINYRPIHIYAQCQFDAISHVSYSIEKNEFEALTALVGRLSLSVDWENGPERRFKTVSFNP